MGLYGCLWVLISLFAFSWVVIGLMRHYGSLWVLIGLYASLLSVMVPYG